VYVPLPAFETAGVAAFEPVTVTARSDASLLAVRTFPLASRTVIVIVVPLPAVPAGTLAVVCAAEGAPALTALEYGLFLIATLLSVIAALSLPATVGV
jgi:hypothetical protein